MNVPRSLWGEAVRSAAYLMNRTPSRVLEFATPLQKVQELVQQPIHPGLEPRIFGCTAYVDKNTGKLEPRAIRCMFIGYANQKKGYRCYDPLEKKTYVTRDVSFHETVKFYCDENPLQGESNEEVNSPEPELNEFAVEEEVEQQGNDQNDHSNEAPDGRETESESSSDNDGPEPTDNENFIFDVVQETEAHTQDPVSNTDTEAQNSDPVAEQEATQAQIMIRSQNRNIGYLLGVHEGFQNLNIKQIYMQRQNTRSEIMCHITVSLNHTWLSSTNYQPY